MRRAVLIIYLGDPPARVPVDLMALNPLQYFVYFGREPEQLTFHDILRYCFIKPFGLKRAYGVFFATQNEQVLQTVDFESPLSRYPDQNTFYLYDRAHAPSTLTPPILLRPVLRDRVCDVISKVTTPYYLLPIAVLSFLLLTLLASWLLSPWRNREVTITVIPTQTIAVQLQPTLSPIMQPTPTPFAHQSPPATTYQVKPGDTLWDIAQRFCGDGTQWRLIAAANHIDNPRNLRVGTILTIPYCQR